MTFARLSAAFATIAVATTLGAQQPAAPTPRQSLDVMNANVMRISPSLEYDRWDANVLLWEAQLKQTGTLDPVALENMRRHFQAICDIVAQIRGPEEKGRWEANRQLWEAYLDDAGVPTAATKARMRATFAAMRTNVSQITAAGERERWTANVQLWNGVLSAK